MKIIIIEDERLTAENLADIITTLEPDAQIVAILYSIKEAISYFKKHPAPDLIFSDIQLGDGLSFDIFKSLNIPSPVIFCTAYDEYALNAFKANGIEYVLKPFTSKTVADALHKYHSLLNTFTENTIHFDAILDILNNTGMKKSSSVLVNYRDKILPINIDDIALFYIEDEITQLLTFSEKKFSVSKNLEELEQLSGNDFFRANRQYLLNRKSIKDISHYFSRKLLVNLVVPFKYPIVVSKEKTPQFLSWLEK
ncbi:MAG: LytTR family DNA-binding domain-containing protein [Rikenellaceae bacterium]